MTIQEVGIGLDDELNAKALGFSHRDALVMASWFVKEGLVDEEKMGKIARKALADAVTKGDKLCKTNADLLFFLLSLQTSLTLTIVNQLELAALYREIDEIEEKE